MEIHYSLILPRDALTVPVVRRLCNSAMLELGVTPQDVGDVGLALTEACANVIEHSSDTEDEYKVTVTVRDGVCEIRVIDTGRGFDATDLGRTAPFPVDAERGRGIKLMQALVDSASFASEPEAGTIVHLNKRLRLQDDSLFRRLAERTDRRSQARPEGWSRPSVP